VLLGLALFADACTDPRSTTRFPTAPTVPPSTPPPSPRTTGTYEELAIGDVYRGVVSAADQPCPGWPEWPCKYLRITSPDDGTLDIVLTYSKGNLDLSLVDDAGHQWWYPVSVHVARGASSLVFVWEYEFIGAEFELRTSLKRD